MRILKIGMLAIVLQFISCTYLPYEREMYLSRKAEMIAPHNALERMKEQEFSGFVIENVIMTALMIPKISDESKTTGPYYLYVQFFAKPSIKKEFEIVEVYVRSTKNRQFVPIQREQLPIKLRTENSAIAFSNTDYRFPNEMAFDFRNKEIIIASVKCKSGDIVKEMTFEFKPKRFKGLFQLLD